MMFVRGESCPVIGMVSPELPVSPELKNQGDGYGFPFDRPHVAFAQKLRSIYSQRPHSPPPQPHPRCLPPYPHRSDPGEHAPASAGRRKRFSSHKCFVVKETRPGFRNGSPILPIGHDPGSNRILWP